MNKLLAIFYTIICIGILGYTLIGFYYIVPLLFDDKVLIDQNIASLFALISYTFVGINLIRDKYTGIPFSLALTALVLAISVVQQSRIFVIEMLKQLGLPFILTFFIFLKYRARVSDDLILKEASLAAVLWVTLRALNFENIYNILISVTVLCIAYYLLEIIYPLHLEVSTNES